MMVSDCCDAIPYNDIIHEAYGQHYGLCGECRENCGFHDDKPEEYISCRDPGDEHKDTKA